MIDERELMRAQWRQVLESLLLCPEAGQPFTAALLLAQPEPFAQGLGMGMALYLSVPENEVSQ